RKRGFERRGFGQLCETLAARAIAGLVVILQKVDERERRQVLTGFAARLAADRRALTLKHESFRETSPELFDWALGKVGVVAFMFAGDQDVSGVMKVIVPLQDARAAQSAGFVAMVLEHDVE